MRRARGVALASEVPDRSRETVNGAQEITANAAKSRDACTRRHATPPRHDVAFAGAARRANAVDGFVLSEPLNADFVVAKASRLLGICAPEGRCVLSMRKCFVRWLSGQ
jgi:hypothetical protein